LDQRGVVSKVRLSQKGSHSGGKSFSCGALYELLSNPIYIGDIRHKQEQHPGQHDSIVERELWEQVQQRLRNAARRDHEPTTKAPSSPLAGKVFDEHGEPLYAQGAAKAGRRYRYFVSRALVRGAASERKNGWRIAAPQLERAVLTAAQSILADQAAVVSSIQVFSEEAENVEQVLASVAKWRQRLRSESSGRDALAELVKRVQLSQSGLRLTINLPSAGMGLGGANAFSHFVPMSMRRRGVELRLLVDHRADEARQVDPVLLKALARARVWFEEVASGRIGSLAEIARREGLRKRYVARVTKLAFIAPSVAQAIAEGCTPPGVNLQMMMDGRLELAPGWSEQHRRFNDLNSNT
ncbi:MAG: recombinase family protein, partial [Deltaproteobacteria bacterium]|nr:recombinase family protein [Deltaproteobacteria bacterium]